MNNSLISLRDDYLTAINGLEKHLAHRSKPNKSALYRPAQKRILLHKKQLST